jgi:hypothetical protein
VIIGRKDSRLRENHSEEWVSTDVERVIASPPLWSFMGEPYELANPAAIITRKDGKLIEESLPITLIESGAHTFNVVLTDELEDPLRTSLLIYKLPQGFGRRLSKERGEELVNEAQRNPRRKRQLLATLLAQTKKSQLSIGKWCSHLKYQLYPLELPI